MWTYEAMYPLGRRAEQRKARPARPRTRLMTCQAGMTGNST